MYRIYVRAETGNSCAWGYASPAGAVALDPGALAPSGPAECKSGQVKPEDAIGAGYTL